MRSNVTNFEMKAITHCDNNVESVLESYAALEQTIIKSKEYGNPNN